MSQDQDPQNQNQQRSKNQNQSSSSMSAATPMGKFGLEIAIEANRNPIFPPTQEVLRGRWDQINVAGYDVGSKIQEMHRYVPVIPGICIEIDTVKRTCRIFDPLNTTPQGREIWRKLEPILKNMSIIGTNNMAPREEVVRENCTDDMLKEWLYHCRNYLDKSKAVPLTGNDYRPWPTLDAIRAMPGKRRGEPMSTIRPSSYVDIVPSNA